MALDPRHPAALVLGLNGKFSCFLFGSGWAGLGWFGVAAVVAAGAGGWGWA